MSPVRIKTILSILISLGISAFLMRFVAGDAVPRFETQKIREYPLLLAQNISSIALHTRENLGQLFTRNDVSVFEPTSTPAPPPPSLPDQNASSLGFTTLATNTPAPPSSVIPPVIDNPSFPYVEPTTPPQPTSTPRPKATAVPTAEPTPVAPTEYMRPGTDLESILKEASKVTCVAPDVYKALIMNESPGVLTYSEKSARFYNAYDWWHRVTEKKQVCSGYGWYPETGLIAEDSMFAGESCKEGINGDTVSKSLGVSQMLNYYWEKTFKAKTQKAVGTDKVDRRVLFDGLVAWGIDFIDGTKYKGPCDKWEFKYAMQAACVNTGSTNNCLPSYCYVICNNFNKVTGQSNDCNNVGSLFVPNSYCQLK